MAIICYCVVCDNNNSSVPFTASPPLRTPSDRSLRSPLSRRHPPKSLRPYWYVKILRAKVAVVWERARPSPFIYIINYSACDSSTNTVPSVNNDNKYNILYYRYVYSVANVVIRSTMRVTQYFIIVLVDALVSL